MSTLLLDIPFNEVPGATVAQDYSGNDTNASIEGGDFVDGRNGRAAFFPGEGFAEILQSIIPLSGEYTLGMWVKAEQTGNGPYSTWVLYRFAGENRYLYFDLATPMSFWTYLVIIQDAYGVSVRVNGRLAGQEAFPSGWGKPTGFAIVNDLSSGFAGYVTIEGLVVYQGVASLEIINEPIINMDLNYYVGGVNFRDFGVYVSSSEGLLDNLAMKDPLRIEWDGYHGEVVDLSAPRYQPRDITLSCFCYANTSGDFVDKLMAFKAAFAKAGTVRLLLTVNSKVFPFEVYVPNGIGLKKKWSDAGMIGTFELKLREPEPVKRVLKFSGSGTASITLTSSKIVNVYWGDGSKSRNVYGTGQTVSHGFSTSGDHYIIIAGVIEDISSFSSNASTVWNIL